MNCPIDATPLLVTERSGVEIDYCPQCRGVWLDRGELDKILDRAVGAPPGYPEQAQPGQNYPGQNYPGQNYPPPRDPYYDRGGHDRGGHDRGGHDRGGHSGKGGSHDSQGRRRREGFLGNLFDF